LGVSEDPFALKPSNTRGCEIAGFVVVRFVRALTDDGVLTIDTAIVTNTIRLLAAVLLRLFVQVFFRVFVQVFFKVISVGLKALNTDLALSHHSPNM
jgi:hypothetical protein